MSRGEDLQKGFPFLLCPDITELCEEHGCREECDSYPPERGACVPAPAPEEGDLIFSLEVKSSSPENLQQSSNHHSLETPPELFEAVRHGGYIDGDHEEVQA